MHNYCLQVEFEEVAKTEEVGALEVVVKVMMVVMEEELMATGVKEVVVTKAEEEAEVVGLGKGGTQHTSHP